MFDVRLFLTLLITLGLAFVLVIFFDYEKMYAKEGPKELYQVYLNGEKIALIKSKTIFEKYIDNEEQEVKAKYKVNNVYLPKDLYIQKHIGYEKDVLSEEKVYELIKTKEPFTIKGYVITIKREDPIEINVIDRDLFKRAADEVIEAFVLVDDYKAYKEDSQPEIKTTGRIIENLNIEPWPVFKEAYIPVDEHIFIEEKELARFLLFGTLEEQAKYIVTEGDTISNIAFNNKLGIAEFLIVNPNLNNSQSLLSIGEEVEVGLINPLFDVMVEEHLVEDTVKKYQTTIVYDSNAPYGSSYVKEAGEDGIDRVVQKIKTVNGERVEGYMPGYETLKPAINEVIVRGTRTAHGQIVIDPDSNWGWPTRIPYIITSRWGWRWGKIHDGVDISGTGHGSPIFAANSGSVYAAAYNKSLGNYVILAHANDYYTIYGHLSKINVAVGEVVSRGKVIGAMGNTGHSTGTHLHFAVYVGKPYAKTSKNFDPLFLYR